MGPQIGGWRQLAMVPQACRLVSRHVSINFRPQLVPNRRRGVPKIREVRGEVSPVRTSTSICTGARTKGRAIYGYLYHFAVALDKGLAVKFAKSKYIGLYLYLLRQAGTLTQKKTRYSACTMFSRLGCLSPLFGIVYYSLTCRR